MSPEILQASGIGPKEELAKQGIKTRLNLPGVGKNLQDQPGVSLQYNVKKNISITNEMFIRKTSTVSPVSLFRWIFSGRGPLTSPGCEQGGFFKTRQGLADPNLQIRFVPARGTSSDAVKTYTNLGKVPPAPSGIAMQIVAIRPESKGSVMIRDGKASSKPVISTNYLDSLEDRRTLREGLKLARELVAQKSLQEHVLDEVWPGKHVQTDEELDRYITETVHSTNAIVGTCKMGDANVFGFHDKSTVVDTSLRVIGAQNLRVIDASVFPKVPGGQTAAPTYMVAEKAADMILNKEPKAAAR
jgi:choline dehydrogenase-like flavoprotein